MSQEEELTLEGMDLPAMFREDACRRFANLHCQDIDLLHISRMIMRGGSSLVAVGVCLSVDRTMITAIEKDDLCSRQQDKIHKILTEWQWNNTQTSTWATLTKCLLILEDRKLMDDIQAYLSQKEYPSNGTHLSGEQVCVQETSSAAADSAITSPTSVSSTGSSSLHCFMNNTESDNVPGSATSAIAIPSSDGSSPLSSTSQSTLVSGISLASGASAATHPGTLDEEVNPAVRNGIKMMEESFAKLLVTASTELETLKAPVDKVCLYLTSLSASKQANAPYFDKYTAALMSESSISGIFTTLSRNGDFNFLNFRLLQLVVKEFGNQDLEAEVEKYGVEVNEFMRKTKLTDFLRVWRGQAAHGSVLNRQLLVVKLDREWPKATLSYIAHIEKYLANEFELHDFIFRFSQAHPGCVSLVWLIPSCTAQLIKDAMKTKTPNFKEMKIHELIVNGDVLFQAREPLSLQSYSILYKRSIAHPEELWGELAHRYLRWRKPFKQVMQCNMAEGDIKWFLEGKLNVSENCLDRYAEEDPSRVALIWEKDEPNQHVQVTYRELLEMTCRIANVLKRLRVSKHQTVIICMPVFPLAVASMLACARIGAVHSVVFSTFSAMDLRKRILDAKAKVVITANERMAGGHCLPLKAVVDEAVEETEVEVVLVAHRTPNEATLTQERDLSLEEEMAKAETNCPLEEMDSEDPLFIIYTSGTTGEPKGIVHSQAGYLLYAAVTHEYVFDYHPGDVFACVADLGWITGHTYVVYGPLCNGGTTVLFESTATYPNAGRYWDMVERLKVNHFFTTPSAIRHLMKAGDEHVSKYDLLSLRTVASTGDPLDVKAWNWYHGHVGQGRCRVVDAWWQTETGGIAITPPSQCEMKPGFIMKPFLGVEPVLMDENGEEIHHNDANGFLCLKKPIPGMGRKLTGEKPEKKFKTTYFQQYPGYYFTSDFAHRDAAGDYKIIARKDDVIKNRGVWLSVTEIESVMNMSDSRVKETCLIGYRHENHGYEAEQHTCAFLEVQREVGKAESHEVWDSVKRALQREISDEPRPEKFIVMNKPAPKTYSGKFVRHILRNVATKFESLKPGGEDPKETPYREELREIAEDLGIIM